MHRKSSSQQTQENAAQLLQSLYVHSLQVLEAVIKQSAFFFFFMKKIKIIIVHVLYLHSKKCVFFCLQSFCLYFGNKSLPVGGNMHLDTFDNSFEDRKTHIFWSANKEHAL